MDRINSAQPASDQRAHDGYGLDTLQTPGSKSRVKAGLTLANFATGARPSLSVVVPCYNEEESIQACHVQLSESLASAGRSYEIVYVNDGSRDLTMQILRTIQAGDPHIQVINLSRNFGHQVAVSAGIRYAAGGAVALMDADLQDPPEALMEMMNMLETGYDVVYG